MYRCFYNIVADEFVVRISKHNIYNKLITSNLVLIINYNIKRNVLSNVSS